MCSQSVVFGVPSTADGIGEAILVQFNSFVNGPDADLSSTDYRSQVFTYVVLYLVTALVLFLLLAQAQRHVPALPWPLPCPSLSRYLALPPAIGTRSGLPYSFSSPSSSMHSMLLLRRHTASWTTPSSLLASHSQAVLVRRSATPLTALSARLLNCGDPKSPLVSR